MDDATGAGGGGCMEGFLTDRVREAPGAATGRPAA